MPRHPPPPPPPIAWDDAPRCLVTKAALAGDMCLSPAAIAITFVALNGTTLCPKCGVAPVLFVPAPHATTVPSARNARL